jgi:hypothetical protein
MPRSLLLALFSFGAILAPIAISAETLPPLNGQAPPQTFEAMWSGFDPRAEPLELEVLKQWEQDGVVLRVVRFRVGIFKGHKAWLAGIYGFPKGGKNLPGLVQIHGGGQYAHLEAPLQNAKSGYATLSIAWAGRIAAADYHVSPDEVKLFWEQKTDDPRYRITTDWGALDAYHAPNRHGGSVNWVTLQPTPWTLDDVESPRNSNWFLCVLAARRALTFLERQEEVDPDRLGVYGHSMGGKLTVMTAAADSRVKAAAPSCGGVSDRDNDSPLYRRTIGDDANLPHIKCPIIFLSPSNDFHGRIDDLQQAVGEIATDRWRVTCSPHHNHQDTPEYEVATLLWFNEHLKGEFEWPRAPQTTLELKTDDGVPEFIVKPDPSRPNLGVAVYYTQQGQPGDEKFDLQNTISRFWHCAQVVRAGDVWKAKLPLQSADRPLWVYANVLYPLESEVAGAGYYYRPYTARMFNLSSTMAIVEAEDLKASGVRLTASPSRVIESFTGDWQKHWFSYQPQESWARSTHKIYDHLWRAPPSAVLSLEVHAQEPNRLVIGMDEFAAEASLHGGEAWQSVVLRPADFLDARGRAMPDWNGRKELRLGPLEQLRATEGGDTAIRRVGADWNGAAPEFRNLRWAPD